MTESNQKLLEKLIDRSSACLWGDLGEELERGISKEVEAFSFGYALPECNQLRAGFVFSSPLGYQIARFLLPHLCVLENEEDFLYSAASCQHGGTLLPPELPYKNNEQLLLSWT